MTATLKIGLTIHLTSYTGWGMVALGLAAELAARADVELSLFSVDWQGVNALERSRLEPLHQPMPPHFDGVLIHADGNQCNGPTDALTAARHVGLMVFEDTEVVRNPAKLERLGRYDLLVTASRWNHELLLKAGLPNQLVHQGIDPTIWHPAPKSGRWRDRFVVFSGGKCEYRKGQDIVVAAYRQFQKQHPEALLLTCWQNPWTDLACDMTLNQHIEHEPERLGNLLDIEGWVEDNGIPEGAHIDLGMMPNALLAPLVREADVAVFASRAEGATNLGAMECIWAGVRTLVSDNTGHRELTAMSNARVWGLSQGLRYGAPRQPSKYFGGIDGWGETSPEYLAAALEEMYDNRNNPRFGSTMAETYSLPCSWADYATNLLTAIQRAA